MTLPLPFVGGRGGGDSIMVTLELDLELHSPLVICGIGNLARVTEELNFLV